MAINIMKYWTCLLLIIFISCADRSSINIVENEKKDSLASNSSRDCGNYNLTLSDGSEGDYYYITDVIIIPLDREIIGNTTNDFHCKTLRNRISFEVRTKYKRYGRSEIINIPNIKSDVSVGEIINPIKFTNASIKLNTDINCNGILIPANKNILEVFSQGGPISYFPKIVSPFIAEQIHFATTSIQIKNGNYKLVASWETYDNKTVQDTCEFIIEFKK
ncbi:MAG: hypothetical protein HY963_00975 [Ignavibacteriales bacterium]|nr:hypothetical protein [Ignavibacteriales bacterium]